MASSIRLLLVLHNHQPVGNFDDVIEQAYQDSYLPFLDVFESYPSLRLALHTSGSLMEWLDAHHPEYVDRLAGHAATGRIEIVGGAYYEPILTMIPPRDRMGQIASYRDWLNERLATTVRGMWIPERVWEQSLTSDLAAADVKYTVLDDFHFKNAGLKQEELYGYYVTEDNGKIVNVFPGSERLRYTIPFASPQETIDYLEGIGERHPGSVIVFADDGEKFGVWPDTKAHVYDHGWLRQFLDLLVDCQSWLTVSTPTEVVENVAPLGKVYLPEGSYREMTEWALPSDQIVKFESARQEIEATSAWPRIAPFVRGGFWRNFKRKYPDSDEMYTRMLMVSQRLEAAENEGAPDELLNRARRELYRGQCNCSYWHGAFGGIYLPHLRNAIYRHLIAADNLLDEATSRSSDDDRGSWVEGTSGDFNLDARPEVRLANDQLIALLAPSGGGFLYELDVRSICHNLLATLTRQPEAYHAKVLAGASSSGGADSIHDRVVFKQEGLDGQIQYDSHPRKSLIDHFYDSSTDLNAISSTMGPERGDFLNGKYSARLRRSRDRVQLFLARSGLAHGHPINLSKSVTMAKGSSQLEIAYVLEGLPPDESLHFSVEFNFAGLPSGAPDRYFYDAQRIGIGELGASLDLADCHSIGLIDKWLGIDVGLTFDQPTGIWTYPIQSVNQSEGGFELVHQSVAVQPHWHIRGDDQGQWRVNMTLNIDTSLAAERSQPTASAATP